MAAPPTQFTFLERLLKSRLVSEKQVNELFPDQADRQNSQLVGDGLVKAGLLTRYHVQMLQAGKHRGFFLGPYKILRPIGQGGMGTVFLAEHTTLSRRVAVKVLPPDKAKDKLTLERFNREARAAAALDHPNIVRLHDISQGNGVNFLVMEFVDGNDLQSLMGQTGPLHYAQAAQYIAQAAAGLHHAHEKGFIHRDIKPANLMLTKQGGSIKILDMGLARSFTDATDNLTADLANGDIAGTVDYLSPEQAMNMPLDERSDIYSLGATFYALVAGYPPFKGTTAQKLMQHQLKEPPSVSLKLSGRVPQALSDVVSKMMAKKPSERFQTAADVVDALGPWLPVPTTGNIITDPAALTPMPGTHGSMTRPIRKSTRLNVAATGEAEATPFWKKPAVLIGGGVGLVLLIGGIITAVALSGGDKKPDGTVRQQPIQQQPIQQQPNQNTPPKQTYKVPYVKADFISLRPASALLGGTGKNEVFKAIGGQQLPAGVIINHFNGQALGEYSIAEVNGATAIGLKQTNNKDGVQIHFFNNGTLSRLPDGTRATLRLTYLFDGTGEGMTFYELNGEPYTKYSSTKLPNTGGRWKTIDVPFTRPVNGKGYEMVVNTGYSPHAEGTIYVRSVELLPPDAPPPVTGAVYEFDAAKATPFSRTGQMAGQNGKLDQVAPGWSTEVYDKAGRGDFTVRHDGGTAAVGVAATGEKNCAQLAFRSHELPTTDPLEEGKKYTAVLEYRTDKNTEGYASVQTMDEWKRIGGTDLTDTNGEWKTVSYNFARPAGQKIQLTFGPKSPNGGYLWVRRLYVTSEDVTALAPARGGKALYSLDLSGQKAFTRTGSSEATGDPAEDVRFVEKSRTGEGNLPVGWRGMPWDRTSVATFMAEEKVGRMAFGMKNVKTGTEFTNGFTGMLFSPRVSFTGPFRVRFTYLTDCDYPKAVQVKFKATAPTPQGAVAVSGTDDLPGTGGKWVTKEIDVNPSASTDGYIEFHLFDSDTNRGFYLSEMAIIGPGQPAEVVAPQPKSNTPADPVKADFTAFKNGSFPLTNDATAMPIDVPGWSANQYAAGDTGELIVTTEDGAKVLTLVNKDGKGSAQVYQSKAGPSLSAGAAYLLKVEYKAADNTSGKLEVREKDVGNWKDCPYAFKLESTGDKWEKRTFEMEATHDYPTVFVLQNLTSKSGNKLSIRSIEVVPLGGRQ